MRGHPAAAVLLLLTVAACADTGQAVMQAGPSALPKTSDLLAAADASRADNRFAEAIAIYQEILVADQTSVPAQYGVAECLLGLDKPRDAGTMFEALAQSEAYRARALQGVGLAALAQDRRDDAAKSLAEATQADPSMWRAWNGLGVIADARHNPQEAESAYRHALEANPNSAVVYNNLGYSHLLAGKTDEAAGEFRKAASLDPSGTTAKGNLRLALAARGDYTGALQGVAKPDLAATLNNIGYVAMQRGDLDAAEGFFARAMEQSASYNTVAAENLDQLKAKKSKPE
jgi:Flp pilus assembly protein TadD